MIHGIDPKTRATQAYWQRKARTNRVIGWAITTAGAALILAVITTVVIA